MSLDETFNVCTLIGGEGDEFGVVDGELVDDFFLIGGSYRVVEVAVELIQHGVLVSEGGWSERSVLEGRDAVDSSCRICCAEDITSSVDGLLLVFNGELGGM